MNIISATQLKELLESENVVVVDARGGTDAKRRFEAGHLKAALFADLETDLSEKSENAASGGRHPLPSPANFGLFLGKLGIDPASTVVVYDDKMGANAAARFWWMLKAAGHSKVSVVSGGLNALAEAGFDIVSGSAPTMPEKNAYAVANWQMPLADIQFVSKVSSDPEYLVIDVRENYRFIGESEPIDLVAGHIPGAENIPYTSNLDEKGTFLSTEALADKYQAAMEGRDASKVIVHCGSGVTACHTLLALAEAGIEGAALYVGSWSEWSRNNNPIAVGSH